MLFKPVFALFAALILGACASVASELDDRRDMQRFCFPLERRNPRKICECSDESAPPWGSRAVRIDCSYSFFKAQDFEGGAVLPLHADTLDVSWNALERVPVFASDSLRLLNAMHNNVSSLVGANFAHTSHLRELYLSWNSIQVVESRAFDGLAELRVLDLSHNNLHALQLHTFLPLTQLETLSLAWNRQLHRTEGIEQLGFHSTFGINVQLRSLSLEACGLRDVVLPQRASLVELNLRGNRLTEVARQLPSTLQKLDLSGNLFEALLPSAAAHFAGIRELLLEDMPQLTAVAQDAFVPLQSLRRVSFQNSRRLTTLHEYAFGVNATAAAPRLAAMNFRGTAVRSFNSTLSPVFQRLSELELNGAPLHCDCALIWLKELALDTRGRCFQPSRLRGQLLREARAGDFVCNTWPRWLYGVVVLAIMFLCAGGVYLVVLGMRTRHGAVTLRTRRPTVGAASPYARVTIEPNRQENFN